jgi:hypothetical protein
LSNVSGPPTMTPVIRPRRAIPHRSERLDQHVACGALDHAESAVVALRTEIDAEQSERLTDALADFGRVGAYAAPPRTGI